MPRRTREVFTVEHAAAEGIDESVFRRRWTILFVLLASLVAVILANSSLNLALPSLARDLHATQLQLTWTVEAFAVVFASLLILASAIGDRIGRARCMQFGLAAYVLAAIYAAFLATSPGDVIGARAVMGVGAAFVMPNTLSIVNVVFPSRERPRAIAIWAAVAGSGIILGGIAAGLLLEQFSWHSIFVLSAIIGVAALVGNILLVPNSSDAQHTPIDWLGGVLVTTALVGLVYGMMEAPDQGFSAPAVLGALGVGVVALAAFIVWEMRSSHPLLDMRLFRDPAFGVAALAITLAFFAMLDAFFGNSQVFQLVLGLSPVTSALGFVPIMLPMVVLAPYIPRVVDRIGTRWTVAPGLGLVAVGFVLMSLWPHHPSYVQVAGAMIVLIIGMAFTMTPATSMLMSAVPRNRSGMGSAMNNTTRQLGGALGIAVLGSLVSSGYTRMMADPVSALPEAQQDLAQGSLAGALQVADQLGLAGAALRDAAQSAYMTASSRSMLIGAVITVAAAVVAAVGMPHREASSR